MLTSFWSEYLKGRDHLEDLGVNKKTILEHILGRQGGKLWTGWIHLAQDRDQWLL
jgi:hypothetical protein